MQLSFEQSLPSPSQSSSRLDVSHTSGTSSPSSSSSSSSALLRHRAAQSLGPKHMHLIALAQVLQLHSHTQTTPLHPSTLKSSFETPSSVSAVQPPGLPLFAARAVTRRRRHFRAVPPQHQHHRYSASIKLHNAGHVHSLPSQDTHRLLHNRFSVLLLPI